MRNPLRYSFLILSAAALLAGCSSSNVDTVGDVHPDGWYQLHRTDTTVDTFAVDCGGCHVVVDNVTGPAVPPSCFSASFDGQSCHADGPGSAPHPVDGTFLNGAVHGKVAKTDLTLCQECHSDNPDGGPGSNPRFNVGINNPAAPEPGTGCEQCHGQYAAHPGSWAGPNVNNTFHYSAGNIQAACTLCHGVGLQGVNGAGGTAVDCTTCHAETTSFTLDCAACHGFPPSTTVGSEVAAEGGVLVEHAAVPLGSHDQCATCHGVKNSGAGTTGNLDPSANFQAFDPATDTIGDHWDGSINMNSTVGYNETDFGCDLACHANDLDHRLSNSDLAVDFGEYGPGVAPHAVGNNWLTLSGHATAAISAPLDYCVGCHTQTGGRISPACQDCHQTAPNMDLTTTGCTSCHGFPPDGVTPVATDPNVAGRHAEHVGFTADTADCSACHQGGGSGSATHYDRTGVTTPNYPAEVGFPAAYNAKSGTASYTAAARTCAAVSCHGGQTTPNWLTESLPAADPANNDFCQSCHAAGTDEFNSYFSGRHDRHVVDLAIKCVECHDTTILQNGVGGTGPTHWSGLDTSTFELDPADTVGVSAIYDGTSCNNTDTGCHPGPRTW